MSGFLFVHTAYLETPGVAGTPLLAIEFSGTASALSPRRGANVDFESKGRSVEAAAKADLWSDTERSLERNWP
jgi:hypothetical protein